MSILFILLSACSAEEENTQLLEDTKSEPVAQQEKEEIEVQAVPEKEESISVAEQSVKDYEIITETFVEGNVNVEYPQIENFHDDVVQKELNELLREEALKHYLQMLDSLEPDQTYEAEGSYEVKLRDDEILSVAHTSYNNITPSAHPFRLFYTTNLNLKTGGLYTLYDFVEVNVDFINILKEAEYIGSLDKEYASEVRGMAFQSFLSVEEFMRAILNSPDIHFYMTEETLGISLSVPHAAGDYAEFEISISELKEAKLWKEVF